MPWKDNTDWTAQVIVLVIVVALIVLGMKACEESKIHNENKRVYGSSADFNK